MTDYPEGTFGESLKKGAEAGFIPGAMLASGGSFHAVPIAMGIGAIANATRFVVKTVRASNQDVKSMRAQDARNAEYKARKNRNLNNYQFKDIK
jgi:hypothetical protein